VKHFTFYGDLATDFCKSDCKWFIPAIAFISSSFRGGSIAAAAGKQMYNFDAGKSGQASMLQKRAFFQHAVAVSKHVIERRIIAPEI